jgi:hypothetical protein
VETELNQLKKKLDLLEILAAARTQTATRKTMLSKKPAGSFKTLARFSIQGRQKKCVFGCIASKKNNLGPFVTIRDSRLPKISLPIREWEWETTFFRQWDRERDSRKCLASGGGDLNAWE